MIPSVRPGDKDIMDGGEHGACLLLMFQIIRCGERCSPLVSHHCYLNQSISPPIFNILLRKHSPFSDISSAYPRTIQAIPKVFCASYVIIRLMLSLTDALRLFASVRGHGWGVREDALRQAREKWNFI